MGGFGRNPSPVPGGAGSGRWEPVCCGGYSFQGQGLVPFQGQGGVGVLPPRGLGSTPLAGRRRRFLRRCQPCDMAPHPLPTTPTNTLIGDRSDSLSPGSTPQLSLRCTSPPGPHPPSGCLPLQGESKSPLSCPSDSSHHTKFCNSLPRTCDMGSLTPDRCPSTQRSLPCPPAHTAWAGIPAPTPPTPNRLSE